MPLRPKTSGKIPTTIVEGSDRLRVECSSPLTSWKSPPGLLYKGYVYHGHSYVRAFKGLPEWIYIAKKRTIQMEGSVS